jgi:hypothetical protein
LGTGHVQADLGEDDMRRPAKLAGIWASRITAGGRASSVLWPTPGRVVPPTFTPWAAAIAAMSSSIRAVSASICVVSESIWLSQDRR